MEFRAHFLLPAVSKLLLDLGIHPCLVQCSCPLPLLVFLFLSFPFIIQSLHILFFFAPLLNFSHSLFWLLWQLVLLGEVAQGGNVRGEAVFEQDTSVSLAVQLSDEAVPVYHKAWTEPAGKKKREVKPGLLLVHHCLSSQRVLKTLSMRRFQIQICKMLTAVDFGTQDYVSEGMER